MCIHAVYRCKSKIEIESRIYCIDIIAYHCRYLIYMCILGIIVSASRSGKTISQGGKLNNIEFIKQNKFS